MLIIDIYSIIVIYSQYRTNYYRFFRLIVLYAAGPEYKFCFMCKHANDNKLTLNQNMSPKNCEELMIRVQVSINTNK